MGEILKVTKEGGKSTQHEGGNAPSVASVSADSTLSINVDKIIMDSSGGALALTLPDGNFEGQEIVIEHAVAGNDAVVTYNTTATAAFNAAKETLVLAWSETTTDWIVYLNIGTVALA